MTTLLSSDICIASSFGESCKKKTKGSLCKDHSKITEYSAMEKRLTEFTSMLREYDISYSNCMKMAKQMSRDDVEKRVKEQIQKSKPLPSIPPPLPPRNPTTLQEMEANVVEKGVNLKTHAVDIINKSRELPKQNQSLLEEIQKGKTLKHVETKEPTKKRSELEQAIYNAIKQRKLLNENPEENEGELGEWQ
jgi:hypothetical protein